MPIHLLRFLYRWSAQRHLICAFSIVAAGCTSFVPQCSVGQVVLAQDKGATDQDTKSPAFEVASIRPSNPEVSADAGVRVSPGRFTATRISVNGLISYAYNITIYNVSGGPEWADSQEFNVDARFDDPHPAGPSSPSSMSEDEQCKRMVQSLLVDRFRLRVRLDIKVESIYTLVIGKGGSSLIPASTTRSGTENANPATAESPSITFMQGQWVAKRQTMADLASLLSGQPGIGRIVIDETGLKGAYDFVLKWSPLPDNGGPNAFAAIAKLGLKLELQKRPLDAIVIEHVEKPTEN